MNREILHITEEQVRQTLTVEKSLELAKEAYTLLHAKQVVNPERAWLTTQAGTSVFCMPCYINGLRTVSVKIARLNPHNPEQSLPSVMAMIHVYDSGTGEELARIEAETLTAIRTAAGSAVATDLFAAKDAQVLGILGTGKQAEAHIPALLKVRSPAKIVVHSRNEVSRRAFAEKVSKVHGVDASAASTPEEVVRLAQILVLATNSTSPLFSGSLVNPGVHINAIGAALPSSRETDTTLVRRSLVVVDSKPQALSSYGDIMIPVKEGAILEGEILELGELLSSPSGQARARGGITLFKSGGVAALDAICADYVLSRFP